MSSKNEIDRLRFPSGLSVRQAKANAKTLRNETGLPLYEAQRKIAAENGLDMPWEQALYSIKVKDLPVFDNLPPAIAVSRESFSDHTKKLGQGYVQPCVRLESQGLTELELKWFKTLPHVTELLSELHLRGRRYGVGLSQNHTEEGSPKISITLDLVGCSVEQEADALLVPHLREALTAVAKASQKAKVSFDVHAITKGRDRFSAYHHVQSIYDFIAPRDSIEGFAERMGFELIKLESTSEVSVPPATFVYSGAKRTADGFELEFLKSGTDLIIHKLHSDAFNTLADIANLMIELEGKYCLTLFSERQFRELRKLSVLELDDRGRVQIPPTISDFGVQVIRGCMETQHDLYMGRVIEERPIPVT